MEDLIKEWEEMKRTEMILTRHDDECIEISVLDEFLKKVFSGSEQQLTAANKTIRELEDFLSRSNKENADSRKFISEKLKEIKELRAENELLKERKQKEREQIRQYLTVLRMSKNLELEI